MSHESITRVGKFKVRRPGGYIEKLVVYQEGDQTFIRGDGSYRKLPVRRLDPPQDYPGRRSDGLLEYEAT